MIAVIVGLLFLGVVFVGPIMSDVEQPKYNIIKKYDNIEANIEIRQYDPILTAEVTVAGVRDEAISEGFKLLADYIFGNNTAEQDINMTAPVVQQSSGQYDKAISKQIAMTAPVMQQKQGQDWAVHFTMPSEYNMDNIPKPNNPKVTLKEISEKTMIAIQFSGQNTDENLAQYEKELRDFMQTQNITALSDPSYAFYNPPWTLPPMRRNEVIFEIENK